jgi:hypothetical protein
VAGQDSPSAEDAAAAFAGDDQQAQDTEQQAETDGAQPYIRRVDDQGQETRFAILTKKQFTDLFCFAFDAPQQLHPAFRHIATDNGQLYRAEASRATASRIYDLCRTSGIRWLESLLALDQSGLEKVVELALVGWFAIGTLQGAGAAMQELRNGPQDAQAEGAGGGTSSWLETVVPLLNDPPSLLTNTLLRFGGKTPPLNKEETRWKE